ncbi:hypothetical protein [Geotalea sp. SG265]
MFWKRFNSGIIAGLMVGTVRYNLSPSCPHH